MTLNDQIERLFERRRFGIKPGLESERRLLAQLDHPEASMAAIHVAGTNGKGSVSAMVASVLSNAGYRTGLFTSPHMIELNERFRIDGEQVNDETLAALLMRIEEAAERVDAEQEGRVTFFECCAAIAFEFFRQREVQFAVLETGMGGRLDATNVVTPAVSIITRIALDHSAFLGDNLAAVAAEKGGIIKQGRPVVIGAMPAEARDVLIQEAARLGAPLRDAAETVSVDLCSMDLTGGRMKVRTSAQEYPPFSLPLIGEHQAENVATAIGAVEVLRDQVGIPIPDEAIGDGLSSVRWDGRLQVLQREPPVLLDGAHNPDAARVLVRALRRLYPNRPVGLVMGMCGDKAIPDTLKSFRSLQPRVWPVALISNRGIPACELAELVRANGLEVVDIMGLKDAIASAQAWALHHDGVVCIAGSLFLAGEVLALWEAMK